MLNTVEEQMRHFFNVFEKGKTITIHVRVQKQIYDDGNAQKLTIVCLKIYIEPYNNAQ